MVSYFTTTSIHSFKQISIEFHQSFDKYYYHGACDRIDHLRMTPNVGQLALSG